MSRIQEEEPLPPPKAVTPADLGGPPAGEELCPLADLEGEEAVVLSWGQGWDAQEIFIMRWQGEVVAYVNNCPHFNMPLNLRSNNFLNYKKDHLLCVNHYAVFQVHNGYCDAGPCEGHWLTPVTIRVEGNKVLAG